MSMVTYLKEMTPCRVKTKERGDVDITRLVQHGAARLQAPVPVYADLSDLPASRGEAIQRLNELTSKADPAFVASLLALPPAQALAHLQSMRPPLKRDEQNNAKPEGPAPDKKPVSEPEPK